MIRFESGGRHFQLERDFTKKGRKTRLFCLDDGEELSEEKGDLQALLMDLDSAGFENTVAVGQLKAQPGEELSTALKNYAANYYTSGAGNMDLEAALLGLQKRKKEVEGLLRQAAQNGLPSAKKRSARRNIRQRRLTGSRGRRHPERKRFAKGSVSWTLTSRRERSR